MHAGADRAAGALQPAPRPSGLERVPVEDVLRALERVEVRPQRGRGVRADRLGCPAFGAVHRAQRPVLRHQEQLVGADREDLAAGASEAISIVDRPWYLSLQSSVVRGYRSAIPSLI